jgi:hypothetical protein
MLSAFQNESAYIASKKEMLEDFLRNRKVAVGLATRMRNYYNYALMHSTEGGDACIINGLSYSLRFVPL